MHSFAFFRPFPPFALAIYLVHISISYTYSNTQNVLRLESDIVEYPPHTSCRLFEFVFFNLHIRWYPRLTTSIVSIPTSTLSFSTCFHNFHRITRHDNSEPFKKISFSSRDPKNKSIPSLATTPSITFDLDKKINPQFLSLAGLSLNKNTEY